MGVMEKGLLKGGIIGGILRDLPKTLSLPPWVKLSWTGKINIGEAEEVVIT